MISIVIPTLNEEKIIRKTLDNLKTIKSLPYEIVISDGRSADRTVEIAKEYTDKIVVYEGTKRQTIAAGRNLGAKIASGELLVFIDSDVIIPNPDDFFRRAIRFFESDPELVGITAYIYVYPEDETLMDKIFSWITNMTNLTYNNILKRGSASGEFQMMRKVCFEKAGGFNELLITYEDNDMFERLTKLGKTRMRKEFFIYHSGRRAHEIGWLRLMSIWIYNGIWFKLFKKAGSKEWKPIR